jgi:hypothetical protein
MHIQKTRRKPKGVVIEMSLPEKETRKRSLPQILRITSLCNDYYYDMVGYSPIGYYRCVLLTVSELLKHTKKYLFILQRKFIDFGPNQEIYFLFDSLSF